MHATSSRVCPHHRPAAVSYVSHLACQMCVNRSLLYTSQGIYNVHQYAMMFWIFLSSPWKPRVSMSQVMKEPSNIITNGNMPLWETILKLVEVSVLQINAKDCRWCWFMSAITCWIFNWSAMHRAFFRSGPFFCLDRGLACSKNVVSRILISGVDIWRLFRRHFWRNP